MDKLVTAIKALSDDTRLRMINLLLQRECCVCEVMQVLNISQTRASRNLSMLHDAGFLKQRKEGLWSHYSIDKPSLGPCLASLLEAAEIGFKDSTAAIKDIANLKKARRLIFQCCQKL
jgi:ArsR family transcriptional regulator, arsenate/arsenite/antimonite-responsive transcriptional repressor